MICEFCSAAFPEGAVFCPNCGKRPTANSAAPPARPATNTYSGMSTIAPMRESRASVLEPDSMFADRYKVVRKIGEGGMGVVYVATDTNTGEQIVLKLIHPDLVAGEEAVKRLMAEGLTARQIRHPNIVAVYDVAQWDGQPYFTMEYVKGGSLRSWMVNGISSGKEVRLETAAGLMRSMLSGLAEAHRMGIVHRDLKPENVLLAADPDAGNFDLKILDFGIARAVNAPRTSASGTGAMGTPLYMAPEQMTSAEVAGPSADLYSLSVIFYELLMEALPQARWEPVSKNRADVPPAIDALIEKGLSARPRSRFASAAAYREALDAAMGDVRPTPQPPPPPIDPDPVKPEPIRPDPIKPDPVKPDPITPTKPKWSTKKKWLVGIGAFFAIAIINEMINPTRPVPDDDQTVIDTPVTPPVTPQPPPVTPSRPPVTSGGAPPHDIWVDNLHNEFNVTFQGVNFTGKGALNGAPMTMKGSIVNGIVGFSMYAPNGAEAYRASGRVEDAKHITFTIFNAAGQPGSGEFHINHPPD